MTQDQPVPGFEHRSMFYVCQTCWSIVWATDRVAHRRAHDEARTLMSRDDQPGSR